MIERPGSSAAELAESSSHLGGQAPCTRVAGSTPAPVTIVPARATDLAYVLSTWGRGLEATLEGTPAKGFLHEFGPLQAKLIKRSKVLTPLSETGRVLGFIVYEPAFIATTAVDRAAGVITFGEPTSPGVLHWLVVRKEERQKGIGRKLLSAAHLNKPIVTSWTSDLRHVGLADAAYTPFWLRTA